ncbi:MAG: MFS transporter [Anaerolineales bacterium]|nr:MFS transporter [Anaerolineales bacterium]
MNRVRPVIPLFTTIRTVVNTAHRMVYPFLGVFTESLGVSLPMISLALTARSTAGAFGPFLGLIGDSRGRKTGMLLGLSFLVVGMSSVALWPSFATFTLALVLVMLGRCVFDPSLAAYLGDRVPYGRRGLVLALIELSWSLSFIIGVPLVGLLIARRGWMAPFPILAGLGLLSILALWVLIPKDPAPKDGRPGAVQYFKSVLGSSAAVYAISVGILVSASNEVINLVFGLWLSDSFGLKIAALGAASAVIGISELSGESLVAALVDRLGKPRAVAMGILANCLAALALPVLGTSLPGSLFGLFLFYLSFEFTLVSSIPMMTELLPAARATVLSYNIAGHSLGKALAALFSTQLYTLAKLPKFPLDGIQANVLAVVLLDLLALLALQIMRRKAPHA